MMDRQSRKKWIKRSQSKNAEGVEEEARKELKITDDVTTVLTQRGSELSGVACRYALEQEDSR